MPSVCVKYAISRYINKHISCTELYLDRNKSLANMVKFLLRSLLRHKVIRNDCRGFNNLPPRSPDATPCDFFLWGYVKDQLYVPPLPASIPELKVRIRTAIQTITADMLQTVWNELDYRVDVCRITKGAHIEHLYGM